MQSQVTTTAVSIFALRASGSRATRPRCASRTPPYPRYRNGNLVADQAHRALSQCRDKPAHEFALTEAGIATEAKQSLVSDH